MFRYTSPGVGLLVVVTEEVARSDVNIILSGDVSVEGRYIN